MLLATDHWATVTSNADPANTQSYWKYDMLEETGNMTVDWNAKRYADIHYIENTETPSMFDQLMRTDPSNKLYLFSPSLLSVPKKGQYLEMPISESSNMSATKVVIFSLK